MSICSSVASLVASVHDQGAFVEPNGACESAVCENEISARRFFWRPALLALEATGFRSPNPRVSKVTAALLSSSASTPWTATARCRERVSLWEADPRSLVNPYSRTAVPGYWA